MRLVGLGTSRMVMAGGASAKVVCVVQARANRTESTEKSDSRLEQQLHGNQDTKGRILCLFKPSGPYQASRHPELAIAQGVLKYRPARKHP